MSAPGTQVNPHYESPTSEASSTNTSADQSMTPTEQNPSLEELQARVNRLEQAAGHGDRNQNGQVTNDAKSIRIQSHRKLFGYPVYSIAFGPNRATGAPKGHAKGIIAIGNRATGVLAVGGLAQGIVAIGGLSWGLFTVGGCTLGIAAGVGGVALGGIALGGVAVGISAIGGFALSAWPSLSALFSYGS